MSERNVEEYWELLGTHLRVEDDLCDFCEEVKGEDDEGDDEDDDGNDVEAIAVVVVGEEVEEGGYDGGGGDNAVPLPGKVPEKRREHGDQRWCCGQQAPPWTHLILSRHGMYFRDGGEAGCGA